MTGSAKQSAFIRERPDGFVALLLAMTGSVGEKKRMQADN
jgi:hypothetical protein